MHRVAGDGIAGIKRRRRDLSSNGVKNFATALGHGRLKEDLESSTCPKPSKILCRLTPPVNQYCTPYPSRNQASRLIELALCGTFLPYSEPAVEINGCLAVVFVVSNLEGLISSLEFIQSQENANQILMVHMVAASLRCEGVLKIEDALNGLEVNEYEGNQIRLSVEYEDREEMIVVQVSLQRRLLSALFSKLRPPYDYNYRLYDYNYRLYRERKGEQTDHYLDSSSRPKLIEKVQNDVLVNYSTQLIEKEHSRCCALLHDDKFADYGHACISIFSWHFIINMQLHYFLIDIRCHNALCSLRVRNKGFIKTEVKYAFPQAQVFVKNAELLSAYYDNILKKGSSEKLNRLHIEETLEKTTPPITRQMNVENKTAPKLHTKRKNIYISCDAMQRQAKKKSLQKSLNY
ncbi:hypothetical protein Tco_0493868 [Tanacetum coccineum]